MKNKKVLVVSHGKLSEGLVHSAQMIIGENADLSYMGMMPGEHYQTIVDTIEKQLKENPDTQYIVAADLVGGSVSNGIATLTKYPNLVLISGVNMVMVINLVLAPGPLTNDEIDTCIEEAKEMLQRIELNEVIDDGEDSFF